MGKKTKYGWWMLVIVGVMAMSSCGVLNKSGCGCPPIPTEGKMKH